MKIYLAYLNYKHNNNEQPYAKEVLKANADKAGYPFDYNEVNQQGIANAINHGLKTAFVDNNYDACMLMANDILESPDWLKVRIEKLIEYGNTLGLVSAQIGVSPNRDIETTIIGNWLIPRHTFEAVGYFNVMYDQFGYGPIDLDYCQRVNLAKLKTIYAKGIAAKHLDNGDDAYGFSKRDTLNKGPWDYYKKASDYYRTGGDLTLGWDSYPPLI